MKKFSRLAKLKVDRLKVKNLHRNAISEGKTKNPRY